MTNSVSIVQPFPVTLIFEILLNDCNFKLNTSPNNMQNVLSLKKVIWIQFLEPLKKVLIVYECNLDDFCHSIEKFSFLQCFEFINVDEDILRGLDST